MKPIIYIHHTDGCLEAFISFNYDDFSANKNITFNIRIIHQKN